MKPITFILFSYNEEKRIAHAIRCFRDFGPVVLMDGGSTDRTREIAEELGATFLSRPASANPSVETQVNFEFIKAHTTTPWIYWGYVDNIAPRSLVEKLVSVAKDNTYKRVFVPLYTYLWGNTNHYAQKSYIPATFHRDFMDFRNNTIHGMGKFIGQPGEELRLPDNEEFALRHFSTYNENKFVTGYMRYAEEEARVKFDTPQLNPVSTEPVESFISPKVSEVKFAAPEAQPDVAQGFATKDITLETIENNYSRKKEKISDQITN